MRRHLIVIFILPLIALGQSPKFPTKADFTKIYSQAISDFIKDANKKIKRLMIRCSLGNINMDNPTTFQILNCQRQ